MHRDLADAHGSPQGGQRLVVALHEGVELLHRAVLHADFAYFGSHRDGDPLRLLVPDEGGDLGGALVVEPLLLAERWLREVDQRGCIHVDVVEPGSNLLRDQLLDLADFTFRISLVFLLVDLTVIALNEERQSIAFPQGRAQS